jgi:RimJ/RimL family protein N-acetyltransferase
VLLRLAFSTAALRYKCRVAPTPLANEICGSTMPLGRRKFQNMKRATDTEEMAIVCETSRLLLRKFHESDAEPLLSVLGDPEVMRFSIRGPVTREDIRTKYLPGCLKRYSRDGLGQWAVVRKSDGMCIGECGICVQEVDGESEFEISYRMRRDCWGIGLATEAARACRDYGFKQAGLHRLVSIIESENAASIRVAEKMGMTLEKRASFHNIPVLIYSVANAATGTV